MNARLATGVTPPSIVTVGHSTHPIDEFLGLLRDAGVTCLVDVRTIRGSRHNPQFGEELLGVSLAEAGIPYVVEARLGGRRRTSGVDPEVNGYWEHPSFHQYADWALGPEFAAGLEQLIELAGEGRVAIMCAEAVWWRCHRRIIADHLLARQVPVSHLMPDGRVEPATPTPGMRVATDGTVTYPRPPDS